MHAVSLATSTPKEKPTAKAKAAPPATSPIVPKPPNPANWSETKAKMQDTTLTCVACTQQFVDRGEMQKLRKERYDLAVLPKKCGT